RADQSKLRPQRIERTLILVATIKIGTAAQQRNAFEVNEGGLRAAGQRRQRRVVLLLRGAIDALTIGEQCGPVSRMLAEPRPGPPGVAGSRITLRHLRRLVGRRSL